MIVNTNHGCLHTAIRMHMWECRPAATQRRTPFGKPWWILMDVFSCGHVETLSVPSRIQYTSPWAKTHHLPLLLGGMFRMPKYINCVNSLECKRSFADRNIYSNLYNPIWSGQDCMVLISHNDSPKYLARCKKQTRGTTKIWLLYTRLKVVFRLSHGAPL